MENEAAQAAQLETLTFETKINVQSMLNSMFNGFGQSLGQIAVLGELKKAKQKQLSYNPFWETNPFSLFSDNPGKDEAEQKIKSLIDKFIDDLEALN
jgi:hypothetical protein